MKKTKHSRPVWLQTMDASRRFVIIIACFLFIVVGCLFYLYWFMRSDSVDMNMTSISIPERLILPELKIETMTPISQPDAPVKEEIKVLTDEEPPIPLIPITKHDQVNIQRRKSPIVVPHTESNGNNLHDRVPSIKSSDYAENDEHQDSNVQFLNASTGKDVEHAKATQIQHLQYKILQGKMIDAVLEPKVNSDLPGMICATVQRDVYGEQGREKLIPWGSKICGQYSTELKKGQGRLFTVWNTLRRPDGVQVTIDSAGSDQLGTAGTGGYVDSHFATVFGASAMLAIIGAGSSPPHRYGHYDGTAYYYRDSVKQAAAKTAEQLLEPYANIAPTVVVPAGTRVRIYVNKDLDFTMLKQRTSSDIIMIP